MYKLNLVDAGQFLQQYWQKQPLLIKNGFKEFEDPLDEHDLAGLAQQEDVDARIVARQHHQWQVYQGPFTDEDFGSYCTGNWSLLVQSVDRYLDEGAAIINAFDFIPGWRRDDLMVSFSVPGGGVGPHVDQYDVFIIQGKGKRRWQVGSADTTETLHPHPLLSQVDSFDPIIDEVLECGDVLYIPPGFAHCGETLEGCLNYSVGFRAPDQKALLSSFADFVLDTEGFGLRYQDPDLRPRPFSAEVSRGEIQALKALMQQTLQDERFEHWLGCFLSEADDLPSPMREVTTQQAAAYLQSGQPIMRSLACKGVWLENTAQSALVTLYLGERRIPFEPALKPYVEQILKQPDWHYNNDAGEDILKGLAELVSQLLNSGMWSLSED